MYFIAYIRARRMHWSFGTEAPGHAIGNCYEPCPTPGRTNIPNAKAEHTTGSGRGRPLKDTMVQTENADKLPKHLRKLFYSIARNFGRLR